MNWQDYIGSDPAIRFGKPVIKGTRIPVDLVLEKLGTAETIKQLLKAYPRAKKGPQYACLLFAPDTVKNEIMYANAG